MTRPDDRIFTPGITVKIWVSVWARCHATILEAMNLKLTLTINLNNKVITNRDDTGDEHGQQSIR